jgi:hypothetical protein
MINLKGSGCGLILRYYPGISLEVLRKTTKSLSHDSWSPGQDLNPRSPEYEAEVLITRLRRSVLGHEKLIQILIENSERKRPFGRQSHTWGDNITICVKVCYLD